MRIVVADAPERIKDQKSALRYSGDILHEKNIVSAQFAEECIKREEQFPTGLASSIPVAIPHADPQFSKENAVCILRTKCPVGFYRMDSCDETIETQLIFNLAIHDPEDQVKALRSIIRLISSEDSIRYCLEGEPEAVETYIEEQIKGDFQDESSSLPCQG